MRTVLLAATAYDPPVRLTPGVRKYLTLSTPEPRPRLTSDPIFRVRSAQVLLLGGDLAGYVVWTGGQRVAPLARPPRDEHNAFQRAAGWDREANELAATGHPVEAYDFRARSIKWYQMASGKRRSPGGRTGRGRR
jgi:hypothetical protein